MKITKLLLMIFFSITVVACSSGGGESGDDDGGGIDPKPGSSTLGGVAAVGDPIANGAIQIVCAGGDPLNTTTDSNGAWQITLSGQTPPCAVQVSGGTIKGATNITPYHSVVTSTGTANVTPFSDLMLANLQGTATPDMWFAGLTPTMLTSITLDLIKTALTKQCGALSGLTLLCTINPITTEFTPTSGNIMYNLLRALQLAIGNSGVPYSTLLGNASAPDYTAPSAGFNTALSNAYTTTTGFTGNFLSWTGSGSFDASHSFELVRVNGQTGTVTTIGGSGYYIGLAYGPNGLLYGIGNTLVIINPADGTTVKVGDLMHQGEGPILMSGATFSPNGTLYVLENASSPRRAFTVNLSNGALTYVGATTALTRTLEFSSDGTLYGSFADLFTLSASNASTIATVGSLGGVYVNSLTFDSGGTLFGIDLYPSTNIYSVNLSTGLATVSTVLGSGELASLVAERTATTASTPSLNAFTTVSTPSSPQNIDALLQMEKEIKSAYKNFLP